MEIVAFKRQQEHHLAHLNRIRNMTATIDTSKPESLGLKHLALRPKKMQLIEDRRKMVAKENAKLMGLMTDIMNEKRPQPKHVKAVSLNEPVRKRVVDYVNSENQLMLHRLSHVTPVISNEKLQHDFEHHIKAEHNLRRRQMKPLSLPKDLHPNSPLRNRSGLGDSHNGDKLFDASLYSTQRNQYIRGSSLESLSIDPNAIKSVTDFRKEVIATKRLHHSNSNSSNNNNNNTMPSSAGSNDQRLSSSPANNNHNNHVSTSLHLGESKMSIDSFPPRSNKLNGTNNNNSSPQKLAGDSIYEMEHIPNNNNNNNKKQQQQQTR